MPHYSRYYIRDDEKALGKPGVVLNSIFLQKLLRRYCPDAHVFLYVNDFPVACYDDMRLQCHGTFNELIISRIICLSDVASNRFVG